jgi:hypothetical protein
MKCFETGKQLYLTLESAQEALAKANRKGERQTATKCCHCNAWHIAPVQAKPSPRRRA